MIRKIIIRQIKNIKPLKKPKKHMYDIENESWAKKKSRIQYTTYKFNSIKSERKKK